MLMLVSLAPRETVLHENIRQLDQSLSLLEAVAEWGLSDEDKLKACGPNPARQNFLFV